MTQRRATLPTLPQLPSAPRPAGAAAVKGFHVPRPRRGRSALTAYPPPPPGFPGPLAEWVVIWYLTTVKGWKRIGQGSPPIPGRSFYYQVRVAGLGIFVNTNETRVDFLIPLGRGLTIALDPISPFTHPNRALDILKRAVLGQQLHITLIWLEDARLVAGDFELIELALRGVDSSYRAHGG